MTWIWAEDEEPRRLIRIVTIMTLIEKTKMVGDAKAITYIKKRSVVSKKFWITTMRSL